MRSTKLGQMLLHLGSAERKQFARYVASPYFNAVARLGTLLEVLDQHLLQHPGRNISEEAAFALVLPGQPYDQNRFRKDCSALVKLLLDFWAQQAYDRTQHLQNYYALRRMSRPGMEGLFEQYRGQFEEAFQADDQVTADSLVAEVQLGIEGYKHDLRQPQRDSLADADALLAKWELAYRVRKMKLCYLLLNHHLVTGRGQRRDDLAFVQALAAERAQYPVRTQMYCLLYLCTVDPENEKAFAEFGAMLDTAPLDEATQAEMYTAALNYCARRANAGHAQYAIQNFELYKVMLARKILEDGGALLASHFKNIVVLASKLKEFVWAREFVAAYLPAIQQQVHRNAQHFALGYIAFCEGDFKRAEPLLYRVLEDYEDIFYGIDARMTLLRLHYETDSLAALDSLADAVRMFIKRNRAISGVRKANLQAFIRQLRRLAHVADWDHARLQRLRAEVEAGRKSAHTPWLLSKIAARLGES